MVNGARKAAPLPKSEYSVIVVIPTHNNGYVCKIRLPYGSNQMFFVRGSEARAAASFLEPIWLGFKVSNKDNVELTAVKRKLILSTMLMLKFMAKALCYRNISKSSCLHLSGATLKYGRT